MPILYIRTGCPYCAKVLQYAEGANIALELKNVSDPEVASDLLARGGKSQVPYLVDEEHGVEMYESDDIIEHLHATFTTSE